MITKIPFGQTGHISSRILFGAAALMKSDDKKSGQVLDLLLKHGINHIDTAASYGDSEIWVGKWMPQHRNEFFLATKTGERTYDAAYAEIQKSLERLQTNQVDLIQLHGLSDPDEWDTAMGDDGALKAAIQAKEEGLVRFIGVTGHGWTVAAMHKRSLGQFDFDTLLLPYNRVMMSKEKYASDFEELVAMAKERNVAVQTIKSIARGPWATEDRARNTWYQPLEDQTNIDRSVHWVMGNSYVFLNTAGDIDLLPKVLDAAARFETRPSDEEMDGMVKEEKMTSIFGI